MRSVGETSKWADVDMPVSPEKITTRVFLCHYALLDAATLKRADTPLRVQAAATLKGAPRFSRMLPSPSIDKIQIDPCP